MIRAVLPNTSAKQRWVAHGAADDAARRRLPTIEESLEEDVDGEPRDEEQRPRNSGDGGAASPAQPCSSRDIRLGR